MVIQCEEAKICNEKVDVLLDFFVIQNKASFINFSLNNFASRQSMTTSKYLFYRTKFKLKK